MFNLINRYYNNRFSNLYIVQNKNECKKKYLLIFGGTLYCIPSNLNSINNWAVKQNEKGLSANIPVNSNNPIGINNERLLVKGY